ncbi:hypothetical protein BY458DRAFT_524010 [Sporodiniella umbellata]|nr:hypothetical protein BY458DRAFT_524010 [Sporodiniella umbellata]
MNVESNSHLISEVNSQPLVSHGTDKESCLGSSLSEFTQQTLMGLTRTKSTESLLSSELTHQTLLDVNSQPFSTSVKQDDNTLISYQAFAVPNGSEMYPSTDCSLAAPQDNSIMMEDFKEQFATGRMFNSLAELRTVAYEYGKKYNVALTTSKSDKTKVYLICKHGGHYRQNRRAVKENENLKAEKDIRTRVRKSQKTGCKCMVYARRCKESFWVIRKSVAEHNHPIAQDPRTYAMYRSLSPENLLVVHRLLKERVSVSYIVRSLRASGVTNVIAKDIENIQQDMKRRDVIPCFPEEVRPFKEEQPPLEAEVHRESNTTQSSLS